VAESENIVAETAEKIFADLADAQTINSDKKGSWKAPLWQALTEAGLPLSWVPEDCSGSGASLAEGFSVLSSAGRFAVAVPLAETMLAGWLLAQAGIASPEGEMTVAPASPRDRIALNADGTLSGRARGVPFARVAKHIAVLASGSNGVSIALVDAGACRIEAGLNLGGDDSDTVTFSNVQPAAIKPAPKGFEQAALS
jgi:acyl-CoA dehydrogenase